MNAERGHAGDGRLAKGAGGCDVLVEILFDVPQVVHADPPLLGDARVGVEEPHAQLAVVGLM